MTKEDKELLLKDLSARLPYGVFCDIYNEKCTITEKLLIGGLSHFCDDTIAVRPYLRPMSSMTEEEKRYIHNKFAATNHGSIETYSFESFEGGHSEVYMVDMVGFIDWLNKNHFDYRGLIPKGLAIEVTEENNHYKAQKGD